MTHAFAHSELRTLQLRKLTEVSRALTSTVSRDDVLRLTVEQAARLLRGDRSVLMLTNDGGLLTVRSSWGIDAERCETFREPLLETMSDRLQGLLMDDGDTRHFTAVPLVVSKLAGIVASSRTAFLKVRLRGVTWPEGTVHSTAELALKPVPLAVSVTLAGVPEAAVSGESRVRVMPAAMLTESLATAAGAGCWSGVPLI